MSKGEALSPGWLRSEIDSAISEIEGREYISQGLRESFQCAADSIRRSDRLMRPEEQVVQVPHKKPSS